MTTEQEPKPKKIDLRLPRLFASRLAAAALVSTAILTMKHDVDSAHEAVELLEPMVCESEDQPEQTAACDQLEQIADENNANDWQVAIFLVLANSLILSDTVARYRRSRKMADEVSVGVAKLESRLTALKSSN